MTFKTTFRTNFKDGLSGQTFRTDIQDGLSRRTLRQTLRTGSQAGWTLSMDSQEGLSGLTFKI